MRLNFKVRFQNAAFVIPFCAAVLAFVYQTLGLLGVVPPVTQDALMQCVTMAVNLLVMAGVLVDPTTPGVGDSAKAMAYTRPGQDTMVPNAQPDKVDQMIG